MSKDEQPNVEGLMEELSALQKKGQKIFMGSDGPIDVSPDLRTFARSMREIYVAFQMEGFSSSESMVIVGCCLSTMINSQIAEQNEDD